jgi:hypothetical protein
MTEAATMFDIYQNSFLTFASLHGEDSTTGLFNENRAGRFKLLSITVNQQCYDIFAFQENEHPRLDISRSLFDFSPSTGIYASP